MEKARILGDLEAAKGKVITEMQAFKNSYISLIKLSSTGSIGFSDVRMEPTRIEAWHKTLKEMVTDIEL